MFFFSIALQWERTSIIVKIYKKPNFWNKGTLELALIVFFLSSIVGAYYVQLTFFISRADIWVEESEVQSNTNFLPSPSEDTWPSSLFGAPHQVGEQIRWGEQCGLIFTNIGTNNKQISTWWINQVKDHRVCVIWEVKFLEFSLSWINTDATWSWETWWMGSISDKFDFVSSHRILLRRLQNLWIEELERSWSLDWTVTRSDHQTKEKTSPVVENTWTETQLLSSPSFLLFLDFKSSIARERALFHSWNNFTWKICFSRSWMKISWWMFLIKVTEEAADKQTEANQSWLRWSNKQTVDTFLSK